MPKHNYNYSQTDMYTAMYEQYYLNKPKNKKRKSVIRKNIVKKNKKGLLRKFITAVFFSLLLFIILPYSFKMFVADVFPNYTGNLYRIDYYKILYPTYNYLYKDLFLGKYIIKDTDYNKGLMVNIKQTNERMGLKSKLIETAAKYPEIKPSIYVWEYNGGTFVDINADSVFPAASIIKLPVLIEMFRKIEQGNFTLNDTIVLEDFYRAPGSGKLQYSQGGIAHSIDNLARIMIQNSDNSSTNMIIAKIGGMPEVNRAIKKWGIVNTRINNWLPDLDGTNTTTARDLAKMLYNIDKTNIVSSESKRHMAEYLSHVKNNRLIQAGLPKDAILLHKTGDIGFMLGDAGIVKTANGKKYIIVILAKRPYNSPKGKQFIVEASEIIYKNISF